MYYHICISYFSEKAKRSCFFLLLLLLSFFLSVQVVAVAVVTRVVWIPDPGKSPVTRHSQSYLMVSLHSITQQHTNNLARSVTASNWTQSNQRAVVAPAAFTNLSDVIMLMNINYQLYCKYIRSNWSSFESVPIFTIAYYV